MSLYNFTELAQLPTWLFLGYSSWNSGWARWVILAAQFLVIGQIFRAWIGPYILEKISNRVRVRRISLRSIRGVYVRLASMTVRIDRIGISYHPSAVATRRFSFKVEGLYLEIHELKARLQPRQTTSKRFSRLPSLADLAPSPIARWLWSMYSSIHVLLGPAVRPAIRSFFVTSTRMIIRFLPTLTQVIDFELDQALVTFATLPEAHIAIRGVTLSATVAFSDLESAIGATGDNHRTHRHRTFLSMAHLRKRFAGSARRVWGQAWGGTQGSVSFSLNVQKVSGFAKAEKWSQFGSDAIHSSRHAGASQFAFVTQASHNSDMCFDLQDSAELLVSFEVGRTKRIIRDHSISSSLRLPAIQFSTMPFMTFVRAIRKLGSTPDSHASRVIHSSVQYKRYLNSQINGLTSHRSRSSKASLFRCIELSISDMSVCHIVQANIEFRPRYFTGHIRSLSMSVELGEPEKNTLHRDFLGCCPERIAALDAEVLSYSFIARDLTIHRRDVTEDGPPSRVVSIMSVGIDGFSTQWAFLGMPSTPVFPGDPNAALLVIKLSVIAPQLSERVDVVVDILEHVHKLKPVSPTPHEPRRTIHFVPRLRVDIVVDDVAACLTPVDCDGILASSLILSSTQCVISMSTYFKFFPLARSTLPELQKADFIPLEMEFAMQALLGPAFVMVLPRPFSLDTSPNEMAYSRSVASIGGDPLLSLSAFEIVGSGQTLGVVDDMDQVIIDVASTMTDVACTTDAVSVELWQPSAIFSLRSLFNSGQSMVTRPTGNKGGVLKRLPGGITAHFAIGQLGIIVTGKDINPDEELGLSRGIAAKSGLVLQFCSLYDRQSYVRLPKKFTLAHDRQRLFLSEDLLFDAISISSTTGDAKKFAFLRCILWDTTLRTSVATEFAADQAYEDNEESDELKSAEFFWTRRTEINALSSYVDRSEGNDALAEQLQLSVNIPTVQLHFQLSEAYCIFLALTTLKSVVGPPRNTHPRQSPLVSITVKATVAALQLIMKLPLQEKVCFRVNGLVLRFSRINDLNVEWSTLLTWVPSIREEDKWEELARFRSCKLICNGSGSRDMDFAFEGEGARLRIPYGFVMADLILDANVFVKSIKHLVTTVSSGVFQSMLHPAAEDAKVVPVISMKLGCISLEASDDPLESNLGLIWRAGFEAARSRLDREEAFQEKVAAIRAAEAEQFNPLDSENRFSPQHTISVEEAHERLLLVHSLSWMTVHRDYRDGQRRNEANIRKEIRGDHFHISRIDVDPLVPLAQSSKAPPLLRFIATHVKLDICRPNFPSGGLHEFLHDLGKGLPRDTQFTLLVPLHLHITLGSTCITLRDYPLPLLNIVQDSPTMAQAWVIDTDFVVAEEVGTQTSVVWKECPIVQAGSGSAGAKALNLSVPKTTMPVKTYANPIVDVLTSQLTELCWGNSYAPAIQDAMRILDTLTTPPPDPSPPIGFWDKMRLVLHWRAELNFVKDVRLNLKGSRDPYATDGVGAGFAFCWNGNTKMSVGQPNLDNELLQVRSDTMLIVIPNFLKRNPDEVTGGGVSSRFARGPVSLNQGLEGRRNSFRKVCAEFSSGIKWGIGVVLERTCERSCKKCGGMLACRLFNFRPHYEVELQPKFRIPTENTSDDSFNGFRSDFIHLSTSLFSSVINNTSSVKPKSSSFHLTPQTFGHFWSWWELFDRFLSLPIRQGKLFSHVRPSSKKFGRHLATIKYRVGVQRLFISHVYMDDTREGWSEGVARCVGVKALVNSFEADLHQREQEAIVPGVVPNTTKKIRHKPFYAAEVKLTDLQLYSVLATFNDPSKHLMDAQDLPKESWYDNIKHDDSSEVLRDFWFDLNDFVETDWEPTENTPHFNMFPVASCPRFTYFKHSSKQPHHGSTVESSRFGSEDTHVCLMGKEQSVHSSQAEIVAKRLTDLRRHLASLGHPADADHSQIRLPNLESEIQRIQRKIRQLERHVAQLQETGTQSPSVPEQTGEYAKYLMPSDISFPVDWTEFDNVYQAHCPKFSLSNPTRDILIQYYYCSRARRGLEYHMATRAVKYIRDQVDAFLRVSSDTDNVKRAKTSTGLAAQIAAQALRKILIGNENEDTSSQASEDAGANNFDLFDPMAGWPNEAVSQNKSHFCLLLKPQVVLRSQSTKDSVLVVAALQATLQSHNIMDTANIDDPISGRVMTRTHAVLSGLQAFSPSATCPSRHEGIPLEVLLDLRAESTEFDRLVPQTNATFRYDKFNRLRLRNNMTSAVPNSADQSNSHLQHQTDLIDVQVPRFTVSANSKNFEDIANIITTLLLRSDVVHKMHLSKVETLLFSYDFTDLSAAADVVEDLQLQLRRAFEHERNLETMLVHNVDQGRAELTAMKAHIFLLSEELNLIFDAINLAQEKADDKHNDTKMALKVHTSAREISWGMVDDVGEMIAKLAVRGIEHSWLSRQDGSNVNSLNITDLQAFDGSPDAEWPEILSKHREPSNHPLVKRGTFMQADWTVLAPVGGITILEQFILELHPIRLQLEARVGKSIMEYVWPARRERKRLEQSFSDDDAESRIFAQHTGLRSRPGVARRRSTDVPSPSHLRQRHSIEERRPTLGLPSRRITSSRSFTDLRAISRQNSMKSEASVPPDHLTMNKSRSEFPSIDVDTRKTGSTPADLSIRVGVGDDAAEMKTRSAQKTFVLVRISSMHILLSFHKDGSFVCRDARIHTRELHYHNQTWSFEELAEQFIPSDTSWRGWMRMALHQPLIPVLPVARELISKTKWVAGKRKDVRQTRKIIKSKPTTNSPRNSEQVDSSETQVQLPVSPKYRKLRRLKRSIEATRPDDDDTSHEIPSN